ncbi:hypothetical protein N7478_002232 [Penicillium angulare]|uniref:uncharacterized protein n=1 Tax=Penicillium angulare TaxID=116970 RepID=UPI0025405C4A|nr:uncharacterized protein N7478_002232 [Penicillium angulare]KAJ5289202.1 hypothetical protein N7478_002232 [Penicillium angulare]
MPDITTLPSYPLALEEDQDVEAIPSHPLGVKPSGNALLATSNLRSAIGTWQLLPDELILLIFEYLNGRDLLGIGRTCKAFYAFTRAEDLWKTLFVSSPPESFTWRGTWRSTYLNLPQTKVPQVDCSNLYSDALYRPFNCAHIKLEPYVCNIPTRNQIPRLPDLSPEEFHEKWADRPFILSDPVKEWPVYKNWTVGTLLSKYGPEEFRAEAVNWSLRTYGDYMADNADESPLYLFDRNFVSKMGLAVGSSTETPDAAYWPPACFAEDFFSVLSDNRPDHQWLIVGPERSGSKFHKDPNATSAWNAVLRGPKYWIMFPSGETREPPPGVFVSDDQSEVTSPLSIAEWLLTFHAEARRTAGCMEGICEGGEILHVPSGWWHLVVNLEPSIAITQNFIPRAHLTAALDFLSNKADQVSGFKKNVDDPYQRFVDGMQSAHPELLEEAQEELQKRAEGKKRKWDDIVHGTTGDSKEQETGGFSFGFGDDGSDVEVP